LLESELWLILLLIVSIIALVLVSVVFFEVRKERKVLNQLRDEMRRTT
jgi:hypothetical protein